MSASDESVRRYAMDRLDAEMARRAAEREADALEAERARPVPRPDRVVAVDRDDLVEVFAFVTSRPTILGMGRHAYTAAGRIAAAAGIPFP